MKFLFMVCLLFAAALANSHQNYSPNSNSNNNGHQNWRSNNVYKYKVSMRTLTSLGDENEGESSAGKWAGMQVNSRLTIKTLTQDRIAGRLSQTTYGHVHDNFPNGPLGDLPQSVKFQQYNRIDRPFEVRMRNGMVEELLVSKDMDTQEENLLKGLLGGFQYDISSNNLEGKKHNYFDQKNANGVFKKMEREVTGDCEVLYSISPLPLEELEQNPELAPLVQLEKLPQNQHKRFINIKKTKNYANCDKRVVYNFGVPQGADFENSARSQNNFMRRSTNYRIIADRENHTIYSSFAVDKIFSNPMMYNKDLGMVVSNLNMTLESVEQHSGENMESGSLRSAGSLIYSMGSKKQSTIDEQSRNNQERQQNGKRHQNGNDYDYVNEQSEGKQRRSRRSVLPNKRSGEQSSEEQTGQNNQIKKSFENTHSGSNSNEDSQDSYSSHRAQNDHSNSGTHAGSRPISDSASYSRSNSHDSWINESQMQLGSLSLINKEDLKRHSKKNPVDVTVEIVLEIASETQDPNTMPQADTLTKINNLVNWVSLMDERQMEQVSNKIESAASSRGKAMKQSAQQMYLDAVTQSGTQASYKYIKSQIMNKKISGETAAQVVSVMSKSLRYPSKELARDFLSLSLSKLVRQESRLNSTILISLTSFINMAFVDKHTMHNYYPSHFTGRPDSETRQSVVEDTLSALEMELKKAIDRRDDHQAQVFIAAIGNLAHPQILKVFAPYLERQVRTTRFLRQHIVLSLGQLAKVHTHETRYTLFNIYKNEGDDYEVRVAAILELMKTHPTATMLQEMAQQSHIDSSKQVRATIKTAITYAANLDENDEKFRQLSRNAKAAKGMLTSEEFEYKLSAKYMDYFFSPEYNVGHFYSLGLIGSEDSLFHKTFILTSKAKLGGWMKPHRVQASISSISQLIELFQGQVLKRSGSGQSSSKFSADKIEKIFNIKGDSQEALQANLFVKLMNQERFFAVGQDSFENLARDLQWGSDRLREGQSLNYTKFYNRENVDIAVPTITGMMYFHKFRNPVYIQMNGRVQAKIVSQSVNATADVHMVYASDFDGKVGFYCPLGDKHMSAGIINKFQVNIPVRIQADIDLVNGGVKVELSPLQGKQEVEILHRSQKKYTTIRDRESTVPASQNQQTKLIKDSKPAYVNKYLLGQQSTGMAFNVESESDNRFDSSSFGWSPKSLWNNMYYFWVQKHYRHTRLSVKFDPRQSQNQKMIVYINYEHNARRQQSKQQQTQPWGSATQACQSIPSDLTAGSRKRQQQLLQKVASGIENARASLLDIGVEFQGQKKAEFAATIATASSPVDEKVQAIFFFGKTSPNGKQFQINAAVAGKMPNSPMLDFQKALEFKNHADFDIQVNYGQQPKSGSQINIKVQMEESEQRRQHIRQMPMTITCQNQMKNGNYLMPECENATINANMMDSLKMSVSYQNIDQETRNWANSIYSAMKYSVNGRIEEDWFTTQGQQNKLEVDAKLSLNLRRLNVDVIAPHVRILLKNLPVTDLQTKTVIEKEFLPTCALDKTQINTFSDKTYEYKIGKCWHVAMLQRQQGERRGSSQMQSTNPQQTTVLVRDIQGQKEVRINHRTYLGEEIQVEMKHDGSIQVNGKQLSLQSGKIAEVWNKAGDAKLLSAYHITNEELNVVIDQGKLRIVSDGQHVLLMGSEQYRNSTRGLCGRMSNERKNDLPTPNNCYMKDNRYFGATWAMHQDQECEQAVKQLAEKASRKSCIHREEHSPSIRSEQHQQGHGSSSSEDSSEERMEMKNTRSWSKGHGCQQQKVTQFYEENGKICITLNSLQACSDNCGQQQLREKSQMKVDVVCRSSNDAEFVEMKKEIRQGHNVQLNKNQYQPNAHAIYMVPKTCQA